TRAEELALSRAVAAEVREAPGLEGAGNPDWVAELVRHLDLLAVLLHVLAAAGRFPAARVAMREAAERLRALPVVAQEAAGRLRAVRAAALEAAEAPLRFGLRLLAAPKLLP